MIRKVKGLLATFGPMKNRLTADVERVNDRNRFHMFDHIMVELEAC